MLVKAVLFGEDSLKRALTESVEHFHREGNHQGKGNLLLFPVAEQPKRLATSIRSQERLGGVLRFYHRAAA